ncbi:MAG: hypothetical protein RL095_2348 [Verrucomicrobiota bacterium]|jgi:hypothetical protein
MLNLLLALAQAQPSPSPAPTPAPVVAKAAVPTPEEVKAATAAGEGVKVMQTFIRGMAENDPNLIVEHSSGKIREIFQLIADAGVKMPANAEEKNMAEEPGEGDEAGCILVSIAGDDNKGVVKRGADGQWRLEDVRRLRNGVKHSEVDRELIRVEKSLLKGLKELGEKLAAEAAAEGDGHFPEKPAASAVEFRVFGDEGSLPFHYAGALAVMGQDKKVLACLASPFCGKRGVLWSDLSSAMIPEEDYRKLAFAPGKIKAAAPDDALRNQVDGLVARLGATSAKERRDARKALVALGLAAIKPLKPHLHHSDPEVAESVKEILETLRPAPPPPKKEETEEVQL